MLNQPSQEELYKQLHDALTIAVLGHQDQYDKRGVPYIFHPLHLALQLMYDIELAIIAILHDVVEDTDWTIEKLREHGFSERVLVALELLTHKEEDSYEMYIARMCDNYDCIRVKRKDLSHNSDITRLKGVGPKDLARIEKYHRAFLTLGEAKHKFS